MTDNLFGLFSTLVSVTTAQMISLYPLWNTLGWNKRKTFIFLSGLLCYIILFYVTAVFVFGVELQNLQLIKMGLSIPMLTVVSFLFLKNIWQRVFLVSLAFMFGPISSGIGLYAAQTWFADTNVLLAESIVTLIVAALTLPPLMLILRRLCNNPYMKQAVTFWRFIWLLPVFFFALTIMTSSYLRDSEQGAAFVVVRVVIYFALLLICTLLEKAIRQISEAEASKHEAEELSRKAEFYQRMAHELLTPLTRVSTDVQLVKRHPEKAAERLIETQADIMAMADKINKALDESEGGWSG